jgi:hypothetical protein
VKLLAEQVAGIAWTPATVNTSSPAMPVERVSKPEGRAAELRGDAPRRGAKRLGQVLRLRVGEHRGMEGRHLAMRLGACDAATSARWAAAGAAIA